MRSIIHVSDLHFGRTDVRNIDSFIAACIHIKPDLIIVSGDLTQRARISEFKQAQSFFEKIKNAGLRYFVIPGNHDITPIYNPLGRLFNPYHRYKKYIFPILDPVYYDNEVVVVSINTIRALTIKDGRIHKKQLDRAERALAELADKRVRIVVTHHPFVLPKTWPKRKMVKKSHRAIERLSVSDVDMYLSGHFHISSVIPTSERYTIGEYSAIAIQAGTVSTRRRTEAQSFNLITIDHPEIHIATHVWDSDIANFNLSSKKQFLYSKKTWKIKNN